MWVNCLQTVDFWFGITIAARCVAMQVRTVTNQDSGYEPQVESPASTGQSWTQILPEAVEQWAEAPLDPTEPLEVTIDEDEFGYILRIGMPKIESGCIEVFAINNRVVILLAMGESRYRAALTQPITESTTSRICHCFDLPEEIDVPLTAADLKQNILRVKAPKKNAPLPPDAFLP